MTVHEDRVDPVPLRAGCFHDSDPDLLAGHHAEWARLNRAGRAFRSDVADGFDLWYLLRYEDIHDAFQDPGLFSSRSLNPLGESLQQMIPIEMDPPEHTRYRQLLSPALSPGKVALLEDEVRALCVSLVDEVAGAGGCDFVNDFAYRFPTRIFLKLMGLPVERTDELVLQARALLHGNDSNDPDFSVRAGASLTIVGHVAEGFELRRRQPADDLLTLLLDARLDGEPLTEDALVGMGFLLYLAGLDTVANTLSYTVRHLAQHPDQRHDLTARPERWVRAIEEFLRVYSIVTTPRVVTRDTDFAGCPMKAGDRIVLPTVAANLDPLAFDDAGSFDPDRAHNRHLAFGAGPHRCVGAHLARLELRVFLEEWHRRLADYSVAPGAEIHESVGAVAGLNNLPLVWD
jgi:cytochrome P450